MKVNHSIYKVFFSLFILISFSSLFSACSLTDKVKKGVQEVSENKQEVRDRLGIGKDDDGEQSFTGSVKDLLGIKKAQKCTWEGEDGMTGTVYTDGTRSYMEINNIMVSGFDGKSKQAKGSMYTIADKEYAYTWSSTSNEGMKVKVMNDGDEYDNEFDSLEMDGDLTDEVDEDEAEEYNYQCSTWKVDNSKFKIPKDIKFKDMSAMIDEMKKDSDKMKDVCDALDGEDKIECLKAMSNMK